jgi:hypothetical protein
VEEGEGAPRGEAHSIAQATGWAGNGLHWGGGAWWIKPAGRRLIPQLFEALGDTIIV